MRERAWTPPRPRAGVVIERPGLRVVAVDGLGLALVSGALDAAFGNTIGGGGLEPALVDRPA